MVGPFRIDGESEEGMAGYGKCILVFWSRKEREAELLAICGRGGRFGKKAGVSGGWAHPEFRRLVLGIGAKEARGKAGFGLEDIGGWRFCTRGFIGDGR